MESEKKRRVSLSTDVINVDLGNPRESAAKLLNKNKLSKMEGN